MNLIKQYWFHAAAAALVAVIAFNLWWVYEIRSHAGRDAAPGKGTARKDPAKQPKTIQLTATGPGEPRMLTVHVTPKNSDNALDRSQLAQAIQAVAGVQHAEVQGEDASTLNLTIVEPLKLSLLSERLGFQGAALMEEQSPLTGGLRLHVSGMTWEGCANALKGQLSSLEGVEIKGIDLLSPEEGYANVIVAQNSPLTLKGLKDTIAKTPFQLGDVEWTVKRAAKSATERAAGEGASSK